MARKTGRRKRKQLYDRGNVACPICFAAFTRSTALAGRRVTLEHVPPKSIGGQVRCLTCRQCNADAGRGIDQAVAIAAQPAKVTVDILGKRGAFSLTDDGKPITTPFRQFTAEDMKALENSPSRQFTMSVRIPNAKALAASSLKTAYLAMFALLGPVEGYEYVRGPALRTVRERILHPLQHDDTWKFLTDVPDDAPAPDKDISLIKTPVPCWLIRSQTRRVQGRFVVLPCSGDSATSEPLLDWGKRTKAKMADIVTGPSWSFQTFGALRTIRAHLQGADRVPSLLGLGISGTRPDGRLEQGVCIRHVGERVTLLCKGRR